jgi:hypothetical protein
MHGHHLKHMLIGGGALLIGLLAFGVPLGTALQYAIVLACPLMMIVMMAMMGRAHGGHERGGRDQMQTDVEKVADDDAVRLPRP